MITIRPKARSKFSFPGLSPLGLLVFAIVFCFNGWDCRAQDEEYERLKFLFNDKCLELDEQFAGRKSTLLQNYAKAVDALQTRFQQAGNLEGVVAAKAESDSARTGSLPAWSEGAAIPEEMRRPRELAESEIGKLQGERDASLRELRVKYIAALESLKTARTKAGAVDSAVAIAAEISKHTGLLAGSIPPFQQSIDDLPPDLRKGLILWIPLDEEAGAPLADLSPTGLVGSARGTTFTKTGRIGGARSFNGIDDRIELAGQLPDSERFTLCAWIKASADLQKGGIFSDYTGAGGNDLLFGLFANQDVYIRADKSGRKLNGQVRLPQTLSTGWHHLAWECGPRDSTIYLDGKAVGKVREEGSNIGFHMAFIGFCISDRGPLYFSGLIDEVMMWSRSLAPAEIEAVWRRGQPALP